MGLSIRKVTTDGTQLLRLEGRLEGPCVERLRRAAEVPLAEGTVLIVDLAGLGFVDDEGGAALRVLRARGVVIVGCDDRTMQSNGRKGPC